MATWLGCAPPPVLAQQQPEDIRREIQNSQLRLEEIREERAQLQTEMTSLRSRVQNVSGELQNIERQLTASRSVLTEIDFQVAGTAERVRLTTADLLRTREQLRERQAILNRRVRDIYKRGPMHTARVLLGAESFSDLLNRYHYLHLVASYDRALLNTVGELDPFGVQRRANGTVLRWNGIGIGAPVGTPVRAVREGTVALSGPFEGYGPSVIVSHGEGYYTLYLYLEDVGVVQGRMIEAGQVVGTVGGAGTPEGSRVEFQVRVPINGGSPQAVDPRPWLRARDYNR